MTELPPSKTTFEPYSLMEGRAIRNPSKMLCVSNPSYQPMSPAQVICLDSFLESQAAPTGSSVRIGGKRI